MGSQSQSHHSHIKHLASLNSSLNRPCMLEVNSLMHDLNTYCSQSRQSMIRNILAENFSDSFYPSDTNALQPPFTLRVLGSFWVDYDTLAMLSTHIHRQVGKYPLGYPIPMIDHTQSHAICVFSTHTFLYGKNLHTTSKDHSTYLYPLISFLQEKSYVYRIFVNPTPLCKYQVSFSPRYVNFPNSYTSKLLEILLLLA